ncbi:MAG: type III-B CRISPR module RAMP protein Cmr6, partial [Bacteroidota bacterium]
MKQRPNDRTRRKQPQSEYADFLNAPLPQDTVQVLKGNQNEVDNLNLLFNRFVWTWTVDEEDKSWKLEEKAKRYFLSQVSKFSSGDGVLEASITRLRRSLQSLNENGLAIEEMEMSTQWRLVVGMGYKGSLEIGMTLHHLYGFPYIPATAVKGLARAWAELVEKAEQSTIARVFGSESKDERKAESHQLGSVLFLDALPIDWPKLDVDIMNPHYPDYYKDPKNNPPGDWQNPVPIPFLAVAPGTRFWFGLASKSAEDLKKAKQWLVSGLKELGIGAKTSAGYGYFKEPARVQATQLVSGTAAQEGQKTVTTTPALQQPAGTVKAEIIDSQSKPPKVK